MPGGSAGARFLGGRLDHSRRHGGRSSCGTTAIVWDLADLLDAGKPPVRELSEPQIETLWTKLAGDAPTAYDALQALRSAPRQVVPYLRGRMQPVKIDVPRLIADLDVVGATPREIRCIELLESIGSAEARRVLQTLAGGIAEAELTQEAKASLARLARRIPPFSEPGR